MNVKAYHQGFALCRGHLVNAHIFHLKRNAIWPRNAVAEVSKHVRFTGQEPIKCQIACGSKRMENATSLQSAKDEVNFYAPTLDFQDATGNQ